MMLFKWLSVGCCFVFFFSCKTPDYMKHISYFENLPDSGRVSIERTKYEQLAIRPNDILDVKVQPLSAIKGIDGGETNSNSKGKEDGASAGFLVDQDGNIELPLLGTVHVGDLTIQQVKSIIVKKANFYYKEPTVSVRFLNLKVSVLGEVNKPGIYTFPTERNSILDALAQAGDLTIYGKRSNLVLIRDSMGYSTFTRFSLNNTSVFDKDYYYLRQNDIIYVEPSKAKVESLNSPTYAKIGIGVSIVTMLTLIYTQIINK